MNSCFRSTLTEWLDLTKESLISIASPDFFLAFSGGTQEKIDNTQIKTLHSVFYEMAGVGLIKIYSIQDILKNHKTKAQFRKRPEQSKSDSSIKNINVQLLL